MKRLRCTECYQERYASMVGLQYTMYISLYARDVYIYIYKKLHIYAGGGGVAMPIMNVGT
jgi:hypothetical protein